VESSRLERVRVDVAGEIVEIYWHERDMLLQELSFVAGSKTIREKFEAVGASRPVELDDMERPHLRATLEGWELDIVPPEGIGRLQTALERADRGNE
jgi:hypothetical protein